MQAIALHDFRAASEEELSIKKHQDLKIVCFDDDRNWYKAEYQGREGYVPSTHVDLRPHSWFIAGITREDAESLLLEQDSKKKPIQPQGAFLVRPTESLPGSFSLSYLCDNKVEHYRIARDHEGMYSLWEPKFRYLNDLVEHYKHVSVSKTKSIMLADMIRIKVKAQYDFRATTPEQLTFFKNEIITIISKLEPSWWLGEIQRDRQIHRGLIPKNYVKQCKN